MPEPEGFIECTCFHFGPTAVLGVASVFASIVKHYRKK